MTASRHVHQEADLPTWPLAAAAGDGPAAARLAAAGVDVLVAYHSSVLRRQGHPSVAGLLPWANANELALKALPGVVAAAGRIPVLMTVCANDGLRPPEDVVAEAAHRGADGVLNAPTVGLFTGPVRTALESAGLGFAREVELMDRARAQGLRAWGYAFTPRQARDLVASGAQAVVVHLGITGAGQPASRASRTLAEVTDAVRRASDDVRVLAHGGPVRDTATFDDVRGDTRCGFFGASVLENAGDVGLAVRDWRRILRRAEGAA